MKSGTSVAIAMLATTLISTPVFAEKVLNAEEVTALISGMTVTERPAKKDTEQTAYYDANGTVKSIRKDKSVAGKWKVNKTGQLCIKKKKKFRCHLIVEENGSYGKYRVKKDDQRKLKANYLSFTAGNPNSY